jgi:hypothetical protein
MSPVSARIRPAITGPMPNSEVRAEAELVTSAAIWVLMCLSLASRAPVWLRQNYFQDLHLSVGGFVCVHADQGRYSLLRVQAIDSASSSITFRVMR